MDHVRKAIKFSLPIPSPTQQGFFLAQKLMQNDKKGELLVQNDKKRAIARSEWQTKRLNEYECVIV